VRTIEAKGTNAAARAGRGDGPEQEEILEALRSVGRGDFSVRLPTDGTGIRGEIAEAFNEVVELNARTARELRRISRIVGRQGRIAERASIRQTRGEWARNVESINALIDQLTQPAIQVSAVLVAVARGDLSRHRLLDASGRPLRGEFLRWAEIVNTMVDQLNAFASEVSRVAREVGTEGKLGGRADVHGVGGTWKNLTDSVNFMAGNLTSQVRNIAEVTTAQAARAEAEAGLARLRQVVDVMPEGFMLADAAGSIYLHNAAAAEILGEVPTSVIPTTEGPPIYRRLDGSVSPPEDQPLARAVFRQEVVRGEQLIVTNAITGREVPILVNSAPLSDTAQLPAGGVTVFQDITPLHDLDRQRDEFLAAISHDLRTPVAIIKGRTNLLQRAVRHSDRLDPTEVASGLQTIDDSTVHLVRLIDELLDLMRLRMGHPVDLDLAPTNLIEIARRLADEYQKMSPDHPIRVEAEADSLVGTWDKARLERVVSNLLSNAVKYGVHGGEIDISVARELQDGEEWAMLAVRNHGLGIPAAELDRVFDVYYRGTNVSETISGTGVGLAGARHIAEQHGGSIVAESVPGETTTFTVRLPLSHERASSRST
jgi:PAS domain S-box-containing protein